MNKTINELVALTELANDDELIVYDVSEGTSKKIKKSDFVTTSIASGNLKPPTSEAVFNKFGKMQVVTGNANDLKTVGFYTGVDLTNAPATGWVNYIVTCYNDSQNFVKQIAVCASGMFMREAGTTVGAWQKVIGNVTSGTITTNANVTSGTINYVRKENLVTVNLANVSFVSWSDGDRNITTTKLPKPYIVPYFNIPPLNSASTPSQLFYITTDGDLYVGGGYSQTGYFYGSFTYICED